MNDKRKRRHEDRWIHWRGVIARAARSGKSVRAFCEQDGLSEAQFYTWRRKLRSNGRPDRVRRSKKEEPTSFALVTDNPEDLQFSGIELLLAGGHRLRIGKGVDAKTLSTVVATLEPKAC